MTKPLAQDRPKKPKNFPLSPHSCGSWVKVIGGKRYYFGKWADRDAALAKFRHNIPYLNQGIEVPQESTRLCELLNAYDDDKSQLLAQKKIAPCTYKEYMDTCKVIADTFGDLSRYFDCATFGVTITIRGASI